LRESQAVAAAICRLKLGSNGFARAQIFNGSRFAFVVIFSGNVVGRGPTSTVPTGYA